MLWFYPLIPPLHVDIQSLRVDIPGFEIHIPGQCTLSNFIEDLKNTLWNCEAPIFIFISDFNPQVNLPPKEVLFKLNVMSKIINDYCIKNHSNVPDHQCSMSLATQVIMPYLGWYPNPTIPAPLYNFDGSPYVNNFPWYMAVNDIIRSFNLNLTGINGLKLTPMTPELFLLVKILWLKLSKNVSTGWSGICKNVYLTIIINMYIHLVNKMYYS